MGILKPKLTKHVYFLLPNPLSEELPAWANWPIVQANSLAWGKLANFSKLSCYCLVELSFCCLVWSSRGKLSKVQLLCPPVKTGYPPSLFLQMSYLLLDYKNLIKKDSQCSACWQNKKAGHVFSITLYHVGSMGQKNTLSPKQDLPHLNECTSSILLSSNVKGVWHGEEWRQVVRNGELNGEIRKKLNNRSLTS